MHLMQQNATNCKTVLEHILDASISGSFASLAAHFAFAFHQSKRWHISTPLTNLLMVSSSVWVPPVTCGWPIHCTRNTGSIWPYPRSAVGSNVRNRRFSLRKNEVQILILPCNYTRRYKSCAQGTRMMSCAQGDVSLESPTCASLQLQHVFASNSKNHNNNDNNHHLRHHQHHLRHHQQLSSQPHPTHRSPEPGEDMIVWHDVGVQVQEKISQFSNA